MSHESSLPPRGDRLPRGVGLNLEFIENYVPVSLKSRFHVGLFKAIFQNWARYTLTALMMQDVLETLENMPEEEEEEEETRASTEDENASERDLEEPEHVMYYDPLGILEADGTIRFDYRTEAERILEEHATIRGDGTIRFH